MKILFEDYHYEPRDIPKDILKARGITSTKLQNGDVKLGCVGYYHDVASAETIFILPKVFIEKMLAFGKYDPRDLISLSEEYRQIFPQNPTFLFDISVQLYQAIALYNERNPKNTITTKQTLARVTGRRGEMESTLLDHILALLRFAKEHQSLFIRITTIMHSGRNRIHWIKTIRSTSPVFRDKKPYYLECKTKEKVVNYEEELICLFYSTLDYLGATYHFPVMRNLNYETERPNRIADLIQSGKGTRRLRKIRGQYFSDELVQLWYLLYAFYKRAEDMAQKKEQNEYLLVSDFENVFEDMIDRLIGDSFLPRKQDDGKIIDHIYRDKSLIEDGDIYFIADSKYYKEEKEGKKERKKEDEKEGDRVKRVALYKQFTYAKNVIQNNINPYTGKEPPYQALRYRDELTEGYSLTPNFFVLAYCPKDLSYSEVGLKQESIKESWHFKNRLFDRDTLLVLTYNINFLYVLSSYVQSRGSSRGTDYDLRATFRKDVIEAFKERYNFYEVKLQQGESSQEFVKRNFRELIGKIYQTEVGKLLLALKKGETEEEENEKILGLLDKESCQYSAVSLGDLSGSHS